MASGTTRRLRQLRAALGQPAAADTLAVPGGDTSLADQTVGVVSHDAARAQPGYTLFSSGRENFLIDNDGQLVHAWTADRGTNVAYLLPNGDLLRDGSEDTVNTLFRAGGAAGYVERVDWEGNRVWSFSSDPAPTPPRSRVTPLDLTQRPTPGTSPTTST